MAGARVDRRLAAILADDVVGYSRLIERDEAGTLERFKEHRKAFIEPLNERQLHARRRVHQARAALGGISSPAGSCVWHVVGLQRSVREWAIRQGWGGRPVRQEHAQGILIAALGMLVARRGYNKVA